MKRICVLIALFLLFAVSGEATMVSVRTSSNTVSFTTVGVIATFNSVTKSISVMNDASSGGNIYVTFNGNLIGWNGDKTVYVLPGVTSPSVRLKPGMSVDIDTATDKIGYKCDDGSGTITYVATSENIDF